MTQHIIVADYRNEWKKMFEEEAKVIRHILGDNCIDIFHIGSTAVEGLKAKPIIDIMPVVKDLDRVDLIAGKFEKVGYECLGEFGIANRRYLRKGGDERTHQIHIFKYDDRENIERHIAVRDYLRNHKEISRQYAALKTKLALQYPYDIKSYCNGKDGFVKQLERLALEWRKKYTEEL